MESKENPGEILVKAANAGDVRLLEFLIEDGVDVNATDKDGHTPLFMVCSKGSKELLLALIKSGVYTFADCVNTPMEACETASSFEAKYEDPEAKCESDSRYSKCAELLIQAGADVNARDMKKSTALMFACGSANVNCVKLLIEAGADVNTRNKLGWTALMGAYDTEIVEALIQRGANVHAKTQCGKTALMWASKFGHTTCVELLIDAGASVNAQDADGLTALWDACKCTSVDCAQAFISAGADANIVDLGGNTAIFAVYNTRGIDLLIKAGANVNTKNLNGQTALTLNCYAGESECVELLIERGADLNAQDSEGETALMWASQRGNGDVLECARSLMKAGAELNVQDRAGNTALIYASGFGNNECVEMLIQAGADVNKTNTMENTALIMTSQCLNRDCTQVVVAYTGVNIQGGGDKIIWTQNWVDKYGNVSGRHSECVELLIKAGADVNVRNPSGLTALISASYAGSAECIAVLIGAGADVNVQGNYKQTALMAACGCKRILHYYYSEKGSECVEQLIEAGADVNMQESRGWTALFFACESGDSKCVKQLLSAGIKINVKSKYAISGKPGEKVLLLLLAAGEKLIENSKVQDLLKMLKPTGLGLKHLCRTAIRDHLLNVDSHQHLFERIPNVGLPSLLQKYLLYGASLDED